MENLEINKKYYKFWKGKKILITGHTGFKGSWLSYALKILGAEVHGYSLRPTSKFEIFNALSLKRIFKSSLYGDIENYNKLHKYIKSVEPQIIFHLAAQPLVLQSYLKPLQTFKTNVIGTANLIKASKDLKKLTHILVITTDKVYKDLKFKSGYVESDILGGHDPYSASKACTEILSESFYKSYLKEKKIRLTTVRAGNVIGGGDWNDNRLIPDIIKSLKNKKILHIRSPNSIRPWQHVMEAVLIYIKLAMSLNYRFNKNGYETFNVGPLSNKKIKVINIVEYFKKTFPKFKYKIIKRKKKLKESKVLILNSNKVKKLIKINNTVDLINNLEMTSNWYSNFLDKNKIDKITVNQIKYFFDFYK